ncbi:MAG: hypothetical protein RQ826_08430 [Xanthomonadales bacterium]|nr:hypothetical protein [Xanthomonadales bacterium]
MNAIHTKHWSFTRILGSVLILLAAALILPGAGSDLAQAQDAVDATALAKQIDKDLRATERDMHNGKNESADQQLRGIAAQIEQLAAADPENAKLKSLQSKHGRIRKMLDRKLGISTMAKSAPSAAKVPKAPTLPKVAPAAAAAAVAAPAKPTDAGAEPLPRAVQGDLKNALAKLDEAEAQWSADHTGKTTVSGETDPRAVKLDAMEQPLQSANYYYDNILKKCQRTSSPCEPHHPEIVAVQERLDAQAANVAALEQELASAAAEQAPAAEQAAAQAQAAEADCEGWKDRMAVYTDGDKALYRCGNAGPDEMPACKAQYDEAQALMADFGNTPWAEEPCGAIHSTLSDLERYMENFADSYARYEKEHAEAIANRGEIVFSKQPIDPDNPASLTDSFSAGDRIYGLIQTTKPFTEIYDGKSSANVMVNARIDGEKIHAQFVELKTPELMAQQHIVFEIAPAPALMTAYSTPGRSYGMSTATLKQGPNELTHHLGQLGPGEHTVSFDITYFGTTWAAGSFTISGDDFSVYADLHEQIAQGVAASVTLPPAKMTNKAMATEMRALLENAGWENIHRINIVDKDWWIDRVSGGNSPVQSRHIAAAALARDDGGYYYKRCTFHQDKLITGGFGELYLSHQGVRVPIPEANIDR